MNKAAKKALKVVAAFVIVTVVILVGLLLYSWLSAPEVPAASVADPKAKPQLAEDKKEVALDPTAPVGVAAQSITSPLLPGSNALIVVKTRPEALCNIVVEYNKIKSTDTGLSEKQADDRGMVQWSWAVEESVSVGKWPVTVTCLYNEKSGVLISDLEVKTSLE